MSSIPLQKQFSKSKWRMGREKERRERNGDVIGLDWKIELGMMNAGSTCPHSGFFGPDCAFRKIPPSIWIFYQLQASRLPTSDCPQVL